MRLIDAHKVLDYIETNKDTVDIVDIVESIIVSPTVDAVPVIRCKDCKYYKPQFNEDGYFITNCQYSKAAEVNGFCHMARRKEE